LERRYPVLLRRFCLRQGSGGGGARRGGEGVVRELEFRKPLQVSVLSERRALPPGGLHGGLPGARGLNTLLRGARGAGEGAAALARVVNLGGKASFPAAAGDRLVIETPGGGGYGVLGSAPPAAAVAAAEPLPPPARATGSVHLLQELQNTA
jgi:5-oxoprolinase (ATP-hydrolysing)